MKAETPHDLMVIVVHTLKYTLHSWKEHEYRA